RGHLEVSAHHAVDRVGDVLRAGDVGRVVDDRGLEDRNRTRRIGGVDQLEPGRFEGPAHASGRATEPIGVGDDDRRAGQDQRRFGGGGGLGGDECGGGGVATVAV